MKKKKKKPKRNDILYQIIRESYMAFYATLQNKKALFFSHKKPHSANTEK